MGDQLCVTLLHVGSDGAGPIYEPKGGDHIPGRKVLLRDHENTKQFLVARVCRRCRQVYVPEEGPPSAG